MRTNSTFKLPKEFKRILMATDNRQRKSDTKKLFVEAQQTFIENRNKRAREKISLGDE